jgi:hypothetical protein
MNAIDRTQSPELSRETASTRGDNSLEAARDEFRRATEELEHARLHLLDAYRSVAGRR